MTQVKMVVEEQEKLVFKAIKRLNAFLEKENPTVEEVQQAKAWRAIIDQYHTHKNIITKQVNTILTIGQAIATNPDELRKYLELSDSGQGQHVVSLSMGKIVEDASKVPELEAANKRLQTTVEALQSQLASMKDTLVKSGE